MSKIKLWGVAVDSVTLPRAVEIALTPTRTPRAVFTPNAVMLDACRRDPSLVALLNRATLSLPDGSGVLLAAKRAGTPLAERVSGIAFGEALMQKAAEINARVFLLGGKPGVAARAAYRLRQRISNLRICGPHHGYFQKHGTENDAVVEMIHAARPDILLVCFGFPLQEEWICNNLPKFPFLRVVAGLGGSLDVWSGDLRRAPRLIRVLGLEWAWRVLPDPKRWRQFPALLRIALTKKPKKAMGEDHD